MTATHKETHQLPENSDKNLDTPELHTICGKTYTEEQVVKMVRGI